MRNAVKRLVAAVLIGATVAAAAQDLRAENDIVELQGGKRYELYVVRKGDSLSGIAEREMADPQQWKSILVPDRYVPSNPNLILPGQLLLIPAVAAAPETGAGTEGQKNASPVNQKRTGGVLAITKFENKGNRSHDWLSIGIADTLSKDLSGVPDIRVIDRGQVESILSGKTAAVISLDEVRARLEASDVEYVITGSYRVENNVNIAIEASLIDRKKGAVLEEEKVSGKLDTIFELERMLALKLLERRLDLSDASQAAVLAGDKTSLEVYEQTSAGKTLLYQGKPKEARELFRKALAADPKYKPTVDDIAATVSSADTVAIMPFKNASGDSGLDWVGAGFAESLTTDVKKLTGARLIERAQVDKALSEIKMGLTGLVDEKSAPRVGAMVGAGIVIIGSYQQSSNTLRADARMVDVGTGQVLLAETVTDDADRIFEMETALAVRIAGAMHVNVSADQRKQLASDRPDLESFKRTIQAQTTVQVVKTPKSKDAGKVSTIALANFENASKNPEYAWLGSAIPGALTSELNNRANITLVERRKIDLALEEMKMTQLGFAQREHAPDLGKLLGADAVLTGLYQLSGDTIRIDARIIKVETGEVLSGGQVSGSFRTLFTLEKKLADEIVAALDPEAAQREKEEKVKRDAEKKASSARVDDTEASLLARRAYKFELASGHRDKIKFLLDSQKSMANEDALNKFNTWLSSVRSLAPSGHAALVVNDGDAATFSGFLLTREHLDKLQFIKDERDLCLEVYDKKK